MGFIFSKIACNFWKISENWFLQKFPTIWCTPIRTTHYCIKIDMLFKVTYCSHSWTMKQRPPSCSGWYTGTLRMSTVGWRPASGAEWRRRAQEVARHSSHPADLQDIIKNMILSCYKIQCKSFRQQYWHFNDQDSGHL